MYEKVIRDNVHGDIYFRDPIFTEILDTPEMQRLRRISQLGGAHWAFPGANHNRLAHSIGTYHMVSLFLEVLGNQSKISLADQRVVLLAALLHDVGHGPYSHTFERLGNWSHEWYSEQIIENPQGNIAKILKKYHIEPKIIVNMIRGEHPNKKLNLLVSSQLDGDRLDYLVRDSIGTGVEYASVDNKWIVRNAKVRGNQIVYPQKVVPAIESYLLGRHQMYQQIYHHKVAINFDALFQEWFRRFKELASLNYKFESPLFEDLFSEWLAGDTIPVNKYLLIDDTTMIGLFKIASQSRDWKWKDLSDRLLNRKTLVIVSKKKKQEIEKKQKHINQKYYIIEFEPKNHAIYEDWSKSDKDETIWIENNGLIKPLSKISSFVNFTASKFQPNQTASKLYLLPKEIM